MRPPAEVAPPIRTSDSAPDVATMLRWLSLLVAGGALVAASVTVLPYWPIAHPRADLWIGAVMFPIGCLMWLGRYRAPAWTVHAGLVVGIASISVSVWAAGPGPESQASASFYGFLSAFSAAFLMRKLAIGYLSLAAILYLGALALHWRADMATQWAMNIFVITVPCLVISTLVTQLRQHALHDVLTGLPNRRLMEQLLPIRLGLARRQRRPLSIAAIDLDGLKVVNDRDGHAAGDDLLRTAARVWSSVLREGDSLARIGGDEFVLVLPDADLAGAQELLERLREVGPTVAFSAGVVRWNGETVDQLLKRADAALYSAKDAGRGRTVIDRAVSSKRPRRAAAARSRLHSH